jgi:hypothetical protein
MTEIITGTTTLTNTHPVLLLQLTSGNLAMVDYSVTAGDISIIVLLVAMLSLQVCQLWTSARR